MGENEDRATGIIKKVFPMKSEPYGFLKLLTPANLRGEEAVFYIKDVLLQSYEKKLLHHGMLMEFDIKEKPDDFMQSFVPFRAEKLVPLDPAEFTASVVQSADMRPEGKGLLVCLDVSLARVSITPDSYNALGLKTPLVPGDTCIVRISWQQMLDAALHSQLATGEIVEVLKQKSSPVEQRSAGKEKPLVESRFSLFPEESSRSQDEYSPERPCENTNEVTSDEEASSDDDEVSESRMSRSMEPGSTWRRCRSAGDRPCHDAPGFPPGAHGSYPNYGHMLPCMPYSPYMHSNELPFHPTMQTSHVHPQTDPTQCFKAMNHSQCHPTMHEAQFRHPAMNSAHWLPQSCLTPRQGPPMKMTLREYLERGGRI